MAHLGNTYARMEYLGSLRTRHGAQEAEEGPSPGLSMSRGTARPAHDDGASVSDEAFEEAEPIPHLSAGPADSSDEPCGSVGAWQGALEAPGQSDDGPPPISIPARSRCREALPTVAVDLSDNHRRRPWHRPFSNLGCPPLETAQPRDPAHHCRGYSGRGRPLPCLRFHDHAQARRIEPASFGSLQDHCCRGARGRPSPGADSTTRCRHGRSAPNGGRRPCRGMPRRGGSPVRSHPHGRHPPGARQRKTGGKDARVPVPLAGPRHRHQLSI